MNEIRSQNRFYEIYHQSIPKMTVKDVTEIMKHTEVSLEKGLKFKGKPVNGTVGYRLVKLDGLFDCCNCCTRDASRYLIELNDDLEYTKDGLEEMLTLLHEIAHIYYDGQFLNKRTVLPDARFLAPEEFIDLRACEFFNENKVFSIKLHAERVIDQRLAKRKDKGIGSRL